MWSVSPLQAQINAPLLVHFGYALNEPGFFWFNKPHSTNQTELVISEPSKLHQVWPTQAYRAYLRVSIIEQHATGAPSTWKGGTRPQERRLSPRLGFHRKSIQLIVFMICSIQTRSA